jgi:hypothetical protein
MKAVFSESCLYLGAPRRVFCALLALILIGAATASAQSGPALAQRLDSIAGAGVLENRSVGIVAAVVLTNSEPDEITAVTERLAAAVLPAPRTAGPFQGDASMLVGKYRGPGRGADMVIEVTETPQGIAFSFDGAAAAPLPWVESWTFRRHSSFLTFRRSANSGPATELRLDTGGDHFTLKRQ